LHGVPGATQCPARQATSVLLDTPPRTQFVNGRLCHGVSVVSDREHTRLVDGSTKRTTRLERAPMIKPEDIEFGIDTFGDIPRGDDGQLVSDAEAIRATIAEAKLADEVGIDVISVGEHHRPAFAISSP